MLNKLNLSIPVSKDMTHVVLKQTEARAILHLKSLEDKDLWVWVWQLFFFFYISLSRIILILAGFVN